MDNLQLSELSSIVSKLAENPAAFSALTNIIGSLGKNSAPPQSAPPKTDAPANQDNLLSSLLGLVGSAPPPKSDAPDEAHKSGKPGHGLSVSNIFGTQDEIKNRVLLLNSVKPYLSEPRRQKLEAVIKLLRLAELGGLSSIFGGN